MPWLLIFLLVLPISSAAQRRTAQRQPKPAAQRASFPIQTLSITGNRNYTSEQIARIAGLSTGQLAGAKEFDAAKVRLNATGAFEKFDLSYAPSSDGKGYAVTLTIVEAGPFFPVRFEDLGPAPELERVLAAADPLFGPKIPASKAVLDRYAKVIEGHLASKNKAEKVSGKVVPDATTNKLVVVFRPSTPLPSVAFVKFTGNEVIPSTLLGNTIAPVAVGTTYTEPRFRQLLDANIRPLYEARGRVRVAFPKIETEQSKDVNGLNVTVAIVEGPSFDLREVRADGAGLTPEQVRKITDLKTGDQFNGEQVKAGVARLEKALRSDGFMKVTTKVETLIDDRTKTVDAVLHVNRGPQYRFGKLNIQGLDIQSEPVVRKLWALKEGKPFNAGYPEFFLGRIKEDGVFEKLGETKVVLATDDEKRVVDVTLVFAPVPKEPKPRARPGE